VVDFSVTEVGLEEQILAVVVDKEHPELEKQRSDLIRAQNESTIHLKQLEDRLLTRLASSSQAQVDKSLYFLFSIYVSFKTGQLSIQLADIELIENLQATKISDFCS
jgi:ATP-binding dynein motor region